MISFLSVIFLSLFITPVSYAINDTILAVVNDQVITIKDLYEYLNSIYIQIKAEGKSEDEIQKEMKIQQEDSLKKLIENRLLVMEADKNGMQIKPRAIEDKLNNIKKQFPSENDFIQALAKDGLTVTDLMNKLTDQLKAKYVVELEVRNKITVSPQEIADYYTEHLEQYQKPERVDLDSIFISFGQDKNATRAKANEALHLLQQGKEFHDVAKTYSETPPIGIINHGQLIPILEQTIFNLKENEISSLVEVENGIYIFKLKQKFPAQTSSLNDVSDDIQEIIFQNKFQTRLRNWIDKLIKNAYVEIKS